MWYYGDRAWDSIPALPLTSWLNWWSVCLLGDLGSVPESGISPGEGNGYPLQYSYLENPHGWMSLVGYSPWGHKELDMTEWLTDCLSPALWPWAGCLTSLCLTLLFGKWANNCTQIISLRINGERLDLKINKRLKKKSIIKHKFVWLQ